jgi:DNA repair protein RecN (Recombination protein N)
MLAELRIVDLGVIGEAVLEPGPGLTVVTGETGAGKTMVVTGLSLLAGQKADQRLIRAGAARALVEGRLRVDADEAERLAELGALVEDGEVLIARQLSPSRSRITVGGAQVNAATAQELAEGWVTVHGQLEQVRLGTEGRQRELLDAFAGERVAAALAEYRDVYAQCRQARADLAELRARADARQRELGLLRFGLEEIAAVDPQPDEDTALAAESAKLQAVDDLRLAVREALTALAGDEDDYAERADALSLAAAARKALAGAADTDSELRPAADQLADAETALADVAGTLSSYLGALEADPVRLEWIAGRRAELQALTRKYGSNVAEVLGWQAEAVQQVFELESADTRIDTLELELGQLQGRLAELAAVITEARLAASAELAELTAKELAALAMPHARLAFEVSQVEPGPHGQDQIKLLFSANPGAVPGPLAKIASGGELSRVRLALEVVLASAQPGQTFVFDEVDAGVGGQVALEVGRRLSRLAQHSQVIVVTHLAQVAAFADRHFVVSKAVDGQVTSSSVHEVAADERLAQLATMMSGLEGSESALGHAAELLRQTAAR